jgi:hypothetical protein
MYPLVHLWARIRHEENDQRHLARRTLHILAKQQEKGCPGCQLHRHILHISTVCEDLEPCTNSAESISNLNDQTGLLKMDQSLDEAVVAYLTGTLWQIKGQVDGVLHYLRQSRQIQSVWGQPEPRHWEILYPLITQNRRLQSEKRGPLAWISCQAMEQLGFMHPRTLELIGNYAWSLATSEYIERNLLGRNWYIWLIQRRTQVLGYWDPATAGALMGLGVALFNSNESDRDESLSLIRQAAKVRIHTLGHEDILTQNAVRILTEAGNACEPSEEFENTLRWLIDFELQYGVEPLFINRNRIELLVEPPTPAECQNIFIAAQIAWKLSTEERFEAAKFLYACLLRDGYEFEYKSLVHSWLFLFSDSLLWDKTNRELINEAWTFWREMDGLISDREIEGNGPICAMATTALFISLWAAKGNNTLESQIWLRRLYRTGSELHGVRWSLPCNWSPTVERRETTMINEWRTEAAWLYIISRPSKLLSFMHYGRFPWYDNLRRDWWSKEMFNMDLGSILGLTALHETLSVDPRLGFWIMLTGGFTPHRDDQELLRNFLDIEWQNSACPGRVLYNTLQFAFTWYDDRPSAMPFCPDLVHGDSWYICRIDYS